MDFSPQQATAIDRVGAWINDSRSETEPFYLAGYAGTGKTTLAKHLAGLQDGEVLFGAYTGKAASVLRRKGCNAETIHSLIYSLLPPNEKEAKEAKKAMDAATDPREKQRLKLELQKLNAPHFVLNDDSKLLGASLCIIDEVSMVDEEMGKDLLSFGVPILVLGDPGQLPPVKGAGYFTSRQPDFLLEEIHRQAQGSPIINMATQVRKGGRLRAGYMGDSRVMNRYEDPMELPYHCDQIITGRNITRKKFNEKARDARGYTLGPPREGDKIICLRNNKELGLLNGTQWIVTQAEDMGLYVHMEIMDIDKLDDIDAKPKSVDAHAFDVDVTEMTMYSRKMFNEFDFGYAITCHKSQGSQWPGVFIQDESYCFREDRARWLYTALTRAESRVIVQL